MKPIDGWSHVQKHGQNVVQTDPPSRVIQKELDRAIKLKTDILTDASSIEKLARQTNLAISDVTMWLKHLQLIKSRRMAGAKKAAATRKAKAGRDKSTNK